MRLRLCTLFVAALMALSTGPALADEPIGTNSVALPPGGDDEPPPGDGGGGGGELTP
jgi:hypothetical protein